MNGFGFQVKDAADNSLFMVQHFERQSVTDQCGISPASRRIFLRSSDGRPAGHAFRIRRTQATKKLAA
jgi:hypothetical protein